MAGYDYSENFWHGTGSRSVNSGVRPTTFESITKELSLDTRLSSAVNMDKLNTLKKAYMDYVSSVYPQWVEEVALYKERQRIVGDQASLLSELVSTKSTTSTGTTATGITSPSAAGTDTDYGITSTTVTTGTMSTITAVTGASNTSASISQSSLVRPESSSVLQPPPSQLTYSQPLHSQPLPSQLAYSQPLHSQPLPSHVSQPPPSHLSKPPPSQPSPPQPPPSQPPPSQPPPSQPPPSQPPPSQPLPSQPTSSQPLSLTAVTKPAIDISSKPIYVSSTTEAPYLSLDVSHSTIASNSNSTSLVDEDISQHLVEESESSTGTPPASEDSHKPLLLSTHELSPAPVLVVSPSSNLSPREVAEEEERGPVHPRVTLEQDEASRLTDDVLEIKSMLSTTGDSSLNESVTLTITSPQDQQDITGVPELTILDIATPVKSSLVIPPDQTLEQQPHNLSPLSSTKDETTSTTKEEQPDEGAGGLDQKQSGSPLLAQPTSKQSEEDTSDGFWDSDVKSNPTSFSTAASGQEKDTEQLKKTQQVEGTQASAVFSNIPKPPQLSGGLAASLLREVNSESDSENEIGNRSLDLPGMEDDEMDLASSAAYQKLVSSFHSGGGGGVKSGGGGVEGDEDSVHSSLFSELSAVKEIEQEIRRSTTPDAGRTNSGQSLNREAPVSTDRVKPQQLVSGQDLDISSSTERSEVLSPPGYLPSLLQRDSSKSKEAGKQTLDKSLSFSASLKKKKGFWGDSDTDSDVEIPEGGGREDEDDDFDFYA